MKLSAFAIDKIAPLIVGTKTGREIVIFFGNHGIRDVYDEMGLPDIGKKTSNDRLEQNMSRSD